MPKASGKPWYKSKTLWTGAATMVAGADMLLPHLGVAFSPVVFGILLFSVGLLNIALRLATKEGITGVADTTS